MNEDNSKKELLFKILILGDSNVGKTSITKQYVYNNYEESQMATLGIDMFDRDVNINNFKITLRIIDTAGQERFQALPQKMYNQANGIIFVFDLTNRKTYENINKWIKGAAEFDKNNFVICGNKNDLHRGRVVSEKDLKSLSSKHKCPIFETSAKSGYNINEAFEEVTRLIMKDQNEMELLQKYRPSILVTSSGKTIKKKNCCK